MSRKTSSEEPENSESASKIRSEVAVRTEKIMAQTTLPRSLRIRPIDSNRNESAGLSTARKKKCRRAMSYRKAVKIMGTMPIFPSLLIWIELRY